MAANGRSTTADGATPEPLDGHDAAVDVIEDGVFLSWSGRKSFRAAVPMPRVLVPVPEAGDPTGEDPGNLVIEGDNRQARVSLFAQYQSRVEVTGPHG